MSLRVASDVGNGCRDDSTIHFWLGLVLYPLVQTLAEGGCWLLRTKPTQDDDQAARVGVPAGQSLHRIGSPRDGRATWAKMFKLIRRCR